MEKLENLSEYPPIVLYNCYSNRESAEKLFNKMQQHSWLFPGVVIEMRGPEKPSSMEIMYPWWVAVYFDNTKSWVSRRRIIDRYPDIRPKEQDIGDGQKQWMNNLSSIAYSRFEGPPFETILIGHSKAQQSNTNLTFDCPGCITMCGPFEANIVNPNDGSYWKCKDCEKTILITQAIYDSTKENGVRKNFEDAIFITTP
jgi:hypothetical protein